MSADNACTLTVTAEAVDASVLSPTAFSTPPPIRRCGTTSSRPLSKSPPPSSSTSMSFRARGVGLGGFHQRPLARRQWPDIPIMLVCEHFAGRSAITRNGVARYVPVYHSVDEALAALSTRPLATCQRIRANLPADLSSLRQSRALVEQWLTAWSRTTSSRHAKVIVTTFVENVLEHTNSQPRYGSKPTGRRSRLRWRTAAANRPALARHRWMPNGHRASGSWRRCVACGEIAPTPSGKTVWAVVGPENRL